MAAVLWSTSGAFTKVLTQDTFAQLDEPRLAPLTLACYRVLFAGLVLLPTLRPRDVHFRPMMLLMLLTFACMNVTPNWSLAMFSMNAAL